MRRAWLAAAVMMAGARSDAVELKVGYGGIAGEFRYTHANMMLFPAVIRTNRVAEISAGIVTFGAVSMTNLNEMFSVGFEIGASTAGEWELAHTILSIQPGTDPFHPDTGDTTVYALSRIPVLARAAASRKIGPGVATVGLGIGAVVLGWSREQTDVQWWSGTPGTFQADKDTTHFSEYSRQVTSDSGATPVFTFQFAPAYHYRLNARTSIGLEIPLQFVAETTLEGAREKYSSFLPTGTPNPDYTSPEIVIGGVQWGINVVYTVKM